MHRATPLNSSFRSFVSGGAASVVDSVDDGKLLQEMTGSFMKGEHRSKIEAPQNYGFSSVTADADKPEAEQGGSEGKGAAAGEGAGGGMGAEAFITFAGGNRSFPTAAVIDDRRHRLKGLEKGDVAMFGQRDWGQQFHLNKGGMFLSGNTEKKIRMQLVKNEQESDTGQSGGGSSAGAQQGEKKGQKQAKGQKHLYDKESTQYFDLDAKRAFLKHGAGESQVDDKHVHMKLGGSTIWVDKGGCWSSTPIQIKGDPESGGGSSGTTATKGSPPLSIQQDGNISMALANPLFVDEAGRLTVDLADLRAEVAALRHEIEVLRMGMATRIFAILAWFIGRYARVK